MKMKWLLIVVGALVSAGVCEAQIQKNSAQDPSPVKPHESIQSAPEQTERANPLTPFAKLTVRESFDSNVYWYKVTGLANRQSWVTSVQPVLGLKYKDGEENTAKVAYMPDFSWYHDVEGEDYQRHKFIGEFDQSIGEQWTVKGNFLFSHTDGDRDTPTGFTGPGGAPAFGHYALRNRRLNTFSSHSLSVRYDFPETEDFPELFVRGVYQGKFWDFGVRFNPTPGSLNYVDRNDFNGGVDFGGEVSEDLDLYVGYRYGVADEEYLPGSNISYANDYHRVLLGLDGEVFPWLKVKAEVGPDIKEYTDNIHATADDEGLYFYSGSTVTLLPTRWDTISLCYNRVVIPASGGRSIFEDVTYKIHYKRTFEGELGAVDLSRFSAEASFLVYEEDFYPGARYDRLYSPKARLGYKVCDNFSFGVDYQYEWTESQVANTPAREYQRHIFGIDGTLSF